MSPLTQGRGLKYAETIVSYMLFVAPYAGAWIEIKRLILKDGEPLSPLTQGRGLKSRLYGISAITSWSPLTQGRGLKYQIVGRC